MQGGDGEAEGNDKMSGFCLWHDKDLKDVYEWGYDSCGGNCGQCDFLTIKNNTEDDNNEQTDMD